MSLAKILTEAPPSIRWYVGNAMTRLVYGRAFAQCGSRTVIVAPLRLRGVERIRLGQDVAVYEGCWLEAEHGGRLTVGDRVYLGHGVHLHAVDDVTVGDDTMVADSALVNSGGHRLDAAKSVTGRGPITIGRNCFVGQNAVILGGVTVGDEAIIGAGAVVTRDVPAGATVAGVPAREVASRQPVVE